MITTAQFEKTNATVKKIVDWAISRQAPEKSGEGSTTNIKAYRMVPKPTMTRARGCLTSMRLDTTLSVEDHMPRRIVPEVTKEAIENAYKTGGSLEGAALILGVSKKCVLNWMKKHNISRNKPVDPQIIWEMSLTMSSKEIANALGYSQTQINKIAKVNGFQIGDTFHKGYATTHNGYQMRFCSGDRKSGYMLIHRAMMEEKIGRKLNPNEIVHHINGNKTDNRIENLQIMSKSDHARLHYLVTKPSPHKVKA